MSRAQLAPTGQTSLHFIADFEFLVLSGKGPPRYKFLAVDSGAFLIRGSIREKCRWECRSAAASGLLIIGRPKKKICKRLESRRNRRYGMPAWHSLSENSEPPRINANGYAGRSAKHADRVGKKGDIFGEACNLTALSEFASA